MHIESKLPEIGTTIFTVMSNLAQQYHAVNLSQGFPDFDPDQALMDRVNHYMRNGKNQYAHMAGVPDLRQRISHKIKSTMEVQVDPDDNINITAGGTQAIFTAILTFIRPGDEVIILEPAFDCYKPAIQLSGGIVRPVEMIPPDFAIPWEALANTITARTRMIIVNTPHNPTGTLLFEEDFARLDELTRGTDILLLSDEVYEHLVFDGHLHYSILQHESLRKRSIAVFSFGKTFHCTGWKVGYAVMSEQLMREFRKVHQFNVFSVNSFVQYGLADHLKSPEAYNHIASFYESKRDFLCQYIKRSGFKVIPSKGSYFVLADYSDISDKDDIEFTRYLTISKQLALIPVSVFYSSGRQDHLVRFCFAKNESTLKNAGKIILEV